MIFTFTTLGRDTEFRLHLWKWWSPVIYGVSNLAISDLVADTYKHAVKVMQMRMIVNTIRNGIDREAIEKQVKSQSYELKSII